MHQQEREGEGGRWRGKLSDEWGEAWPVEGVVGGEEAGLSGSEGLEFGISPIARIERMTSRSLVSLVW